MHILGIDPGFGRCGFAVLKKNGPQNFTLKTSGVITTKSQGNFAARLLEIAEDFECLLEQWKPERVAIEDLFFGDNVTTGLKVAQVRGILIYLNHKFGASLYEPKPVEVKQIFTGNGKASKSEIKKMVEVIFNLPKGPQVDDASDAIAIAYCGGIQMQKNLQ